jgi:hypothetical protein
MSQPLTFAEARKRLAAALWMTSGNMRPLFFQFAFSDDGECVLIDASFDDEPVITLECWLPDGITEDTHYNDLVAALIGPAQRSRLH